MPCTDGGVPYRTEDTRRVNLNARVACEALRTLEALSPAHVASLSLETQMWWAEHKAQDEKRIEAEKAEANRIRLRKEAIAKLTPEEVKALRLL